MNDLSGNDDTIAFGKNAKSILALRQRKSSIICHTFFKNQDHDVRSNNFFDFGLLESVHSFKIQNQVCLLSMVRSLT